MNEMGAADENGLVAVFDIPQQYRESLDEWKFEGERVKDVS